MTFWLIFPAVLVAFCAVGYARVQRDDAVHARDEARHEVVVLEAELAACGATGRDLAAQLEEERRLARTTSERLAP